MPSSSNIDHASPSLLFGTQPSNSTPKNPSGSPFHLSKNDYSALKNNRLACLRFVQKEALTLIEQKKRPEQCLWSHFLRDMDKTLLWAIWKTVKRLLNCNRAPQALINDQMHQHPLRSYLKPYLCARVRRRRGEGGLTFAALHDDTPLHSWRISLLRSRLDLCHLLTTLTPHPAWWWETSQPFFHLAFPTSINFKSLLAWLVLIIISGFLTLSWPK